ncbi:MAG: hypothetical protein AAF757_00900 [Cyanobacteria bacterium P01_D01_bin.116]
MFILNINIMLNLKRTSLILAITLVFSSVIFSATANAEPTVHESSNGDACADGVVKKDSGSDTVF